MITLHVYPTCFDIRRLVIYETYQCATMVTNVIDDQKQTISSKFERKSSKPDYIITTIFSFTSTTCI